MAVPGSGMLDVRGSAAGRHGHCELPELRVAADRADQVNTLGRIRKDSRHPRRLAVPAFVLSSVNLASNPRALPGPLPGARLVRGTASTTHSRVQPNDRTRSSAAR